MPVPGDGLMAFRCFGAALADIVRPAHGEVTGEQENLFRTLAMTTPAAELRDAYQVAAAMTDWADDACTAVEREIASGKPGDAVTKWVMTVFGPARLMMAVMLRDKDAARPARPLPP
jgi:hypothetical protein